MVYRDCELCGIQDAPCRAYDDDLAMRLCMECERASINAEIAMIDSGMGQPDIMTAAKMRQEEAG